MAEEAGAEQDDQSHDDPAPNFTSGEWVMPTMEQS